MKEPVVPDTAAAARSRAGRSPTRGRPPTTDRRSSRWDEHRVTRREELIDAGIEAVRTYGASAGMDRIAAVAGTSKPVIYRYFADKTDLYRAMTRRLVGQVIETLTGVIESDPPPRELIVAGIDAYLGLLERDPELYRFVAHHPLLETSGPDGAPRVTDFAATVSGLLAGPLQRHLEHAGRSPAMAHPWSEGIVGFIAAASLWWLDHRDRMTREQLVEYLAGLLWSGAAGVYEPRPDPLTP